MYKYIILLYITICIDLYTFTYMQTNMQTYTHSCIHTSKAADTYTQTGKAKDLGLAPLAKIVGFADAEQAPVDFTTAPSLALPKALSMAGMEVGHVDLFELNQAFSVRTVSFHFFLSCSLLSACPPACPVVTVCVRIVYLYNAYTHAFKHIATHA